jgi:ABC-type transport system involved in multi-copper enzyme maturation permease subunit
LFRKHKIASIVIASITLILLLITYLLFANEHDLNDQPVQGLYVIIFMVLGCLFSIILPATSITSEKEARSWPILLATTLTDTQILLGKFIGAVRRCLPVWMLLFGHLLLFTLIGYIHFLALFHIAITVGWLLIFLCCTGLYFSVRFRRTTTAVMMNFVLPVTIWMLIPFLLAIFQNISRANESFFEMYIDTNPFVHVVAIIDGTVDEHTPDYYNWAADRRDIAESTYWMLTCAFIYTVIGFFFVMLAVCRMRRNLF